MSLVQYKLFFWVVNTAINIKYFDNTETLSLDYIRAYQRLLMIQNKSTLNHHCTAAMSTGRVKTLLILNKENLLPLQSRISTNFKYNSPLRGKISSNIRCHFVFL